MTTSSIATKRPLSSPVRRPYSRRVKRALASIACLVIGAIYSFPLVWVASMSIREQRDALGMNLIPTTFRPQNFVDAWVDLNLGQLYINTFIVAGGTVILSIGMSVLAAYGFVRWRSRVTDGVFTIILLGMMIPPAAVIIPVFVLARSLGIYNTLTAIILAETAFAIPLAVLLLRGYLERVPAELIDAARVDGASPFRAFRFVVLPFLVPAIATASLFILLFAWNDLILPLTLLPNPSGSTLVVGLALTVGKYGQVNLAALAAAALLAVLPVLVIFIMSKRYYVQGLSAGALKG